MKSCFISAPHDFNVNKLLAALEERDIKGVLSTDLNEFSSLMTAHIASAIKSSDITLCIAETPRELGERLFELGIAFGLGKKVILVASYEAGELPFSSSEIPFIRLSSENIERISDYVFETIKYGKSTPIQKKYTFTPSHPIGDFSHIYLDKLHELYNKNQVSQRYKNLHRDVEKLVANAIRKSGVNVVSEFRSRHSRPDLAIWSDELTHYLANPLIVEIKGTLRSHSDLLKAADQLKKYISETSSEYGLLVYLDGIDEKSLYEILPSHVLAVSVRELISYLENHSFGELIKALRNKRVYGIEE